MSSDIGTQELALKVPLHDQLAIGTNNQIQGLIRLVRGASSVATISEREVTQEIPVAEGLIERLCRAIKGGEAPVKKEYIYSKTVAAMAGDEERGTQVVELVGRYVNDELKTLSIVGVGGGWILRLRLDEQEKLLGASFSGGHQESKELGPDELTQKLSNLGKLKLDQGFIDRKIDKMVIEDFRRKGGEMDQIYQVPEDAEVINLSRLGPEGRQGTENLAYFKVKQRDGQEVIVQASYWGSGSFPGKRDILAAAVGPTEVEEIEGRVAT